MAGRKKNKMSIKLPKLFQRSEGGPYYFRRRVNGKDRWISTKSSDIKQAQEITLKILQAELSAEAMSKLESSSHKLANIFVEGLTGKTGERVLIEDAHDKWVESVPDYTDITENARNFHKAIYCRFADWAESSDYECIEQIDNEAALKYAKHLWESGISGKTYNDHLSHLSRVFQSLNALSPLPYGDPFDRRRVQRRKKSELETVGHQPLEPDALAKVIAEAAADGKDYRDLFVLAAQTGIRLKDAALLKWSSVKGSFIDIKPHKTAKSGNTARIPTSPTLRKLLDDRKQTVAGSEYVIPGVAEHYIRNSDYVTKHCKRIFERALGKAATIVAAGKHRKNNTAIYSFHSFRTTFMSLLASKDVSMRDAMRMMGWESPEMIRVYEKMLEKARGDADRRARELVDSLDELKFDIPECVIAERKLSPAENALRELVDEYSNITIGRIYGISETAVRKWLRKFGIERIKRIESATITNEQLAHIRETLKNKA